MEKLAYIICFGLLKCSMIMRIFIYDETVLWEDLNLAAGLTTNMIANMGKGKHISMETLTKICETLDCDISDVIQLEREENCTVSTGNN